MTLETGLNFCHDFMVVIDTNCFNNYSNDELIPFNACNKCHSFFADKKNRNEISSGRYYITESVFGEIIQQRREEFTSTINDLKKISKKLNLNITIPNAPDFEKELNEYLKNFCISILPNAQSEVFSRIIDRAINKKLPFKQVGDGKNSKASDKGFKDVLIWETLLEFDYERKRIGKVFFITANEKDFPLNDLLPEWKDHHPDVELSIIAKWEDFIQEEQMLFPELVAQNNISYPGLLEMFQDENSDIIELPNYKKKITGRANSPVVEIETDVKMKDGTTYSSKYYYDIRVNDITLIDPDEYETNEENYDNLE